MTFAADALLIALCTISQLIVCLLLSIRRSQQQPYLCTVSTPWRLLTGVSAMRLTGLFVAAFTFSLPYLVATNDPLMQSGLRCAAFFYACKLLDLCVARVEEPPTCVEESGPSDGARTPISMGSFADCIRYAYLLATEMRYFSFDIAVSQKGRPKPGQDTLGHRWNWMPAKLISVLVILVPTPEVKCLFLLLCIQLALEAVHSIFHFNRKSCHQSLFYKPFAADSFTCFWATHWHAAAAPFLHSLAYQPGRRYVGKWFGVLATFSLTGIWHAWAAAPQVDSAHQAELAFKVWTMFMVMGLGILAEQAWNGGKHGGLVQRILVWVIAIASAGWAFRTMECHARIGLLRTDTC